MTHANGGPRGGSWVRWCFGVAISAVLGISAHAQYPDDSLIRIQPRDSGRVTVTAAFGLVQSDTAEPERTKGFPRLVVRATVGPRNGAPALYEGVDVLFGFFSAAPDALRPAFAYQVGDAPAKILGARWNCVPGKQGDRLYGVFTRVPVRAIRSMTDTAHVSVYAAGVKYELFSGGKRILRALVAHLPSDSAMPAMVPADTSLRAYYDFEVEKPAQARNVGRLPPIKSAEPPKGKVVLEFIVDTAGRVEQGSVKIVQSTNASLANALRKSMYDWTFEPATICGRPVPQVAKQSITMGAP